MGFGFEVVVVDDLGVFWASNLKMKQGSSGDGCSLGTRGFSRLSFLDSPLYYSFLAATSGPRDLRDSGFRV